MIDDFVLLSYFVGNDFLPHIPILRIGDQAFDILFDAYKNAQDYFAANQDRNSNTDNDDDESDYDYLTRNDYLFKTIVENGELKDWQFFEMVLFYVRQ